MTDLTEQVAERLAAEIRATLDGYGIEDDPSYQPGYALLVDDLVTGAREYAAQVLREVAEQIEQTSSATANVSSVWFLGMNDAAVLLRARADQEAKA